MLGIIAGMGKKQAILISVVALVILGAALGYYFSPYPEKDKAPSVPNAAQGVLPPIGEAANPLSNKPDINPAGKINPFTEVKTNPFD